MAGGVVKTRGKRNNKVNEQLEIKGRQSRKKTISRKTKAKRKKKTRVKLSQPSAPTVSLLIGSYYDDIGPLTL